MGQKFCSDCGAALTPSSTSGVETDEGVRSAELRVVSVLFVDLVGFTSLSESRQAEDVRTLLGIYYESARTIVERYGGVIEKFIGDAVMSVWGVPVAHEDDAERAVRAALELVDAVEVWGAEVGADELRARAGVVTGQVAAAENPGEGWVVGDRVNTASRVQTLAAPSSVLVDDVTRFLTAAAVVFEDAGEHAVKGKAQPLRLWRAVRLVTGAGGAEHEQALDAPFVGRDGDLRLLKELFHVSLERRAARLVAVAGEAGVGKTRLCREFADYVGGLAEDVLWHSGRCLPHGEGVAYWALAEMVRERLGIAEGAPTDYAASRLSAGLDRWVAEPADREFLRSRLGALLGVAGPGLGREELFAGWRLFFERLAAHRPVLLVFEDMQWADPGLLDFIEQLLDWSAASPIFLLTLARPELATSREGWPSGRRGASTLQLEPLDDVAMLTLLNGVVDGLPESAAQRIIEQAQGVALYAIETVRALADRGVLVEHDGRLVLEGELGELDVPASLSSLLAARLDALAPDERGLVKAMSVFGGTFPRSAAAALADVSDDQLDGVLAGLVRRQVLVIRAAPLSPDRGQYAFAQGLLRTVAYEMLSRQERRPRHRAAAEHLRRVYANDGEEVAELIASHYLSAYRAAQGDLDAEDLRVETLAALRRAALRASAVGAPEAAERAYGSAIALAADEVERTELTQATGEMALQAGRFEPALELLEAALNAHTGAGRERDAARIAGRIGLVLEGLGNNEEAAERITTALEILASDQLDAEVGELNRALGGALVFAGDYERAAPPLDVALKIGQALKLPGLISNALTIKANLYLHTGRAEEARCLFAGAIAIAQRHDLPDALGRALGNSGNLATQWDLPDAGEQCVSSLAVARRRGDRYMESISAGNLTAVHLMAGRWPEAEQMAAERLKDNPTRAGTAHADYPMVILHLLRGQPEAARASLDRLTEWTHSDDEEHQAMHASATISVHLAAGRAEEALEQGKRLLSHAIAKLGASNQSVRNAWPDTLEAALWLARPEDAHGLLALLTELPPGHIPPYLEAQLIRGRARLAAAEGRSDTVEEDFKTAIDSFQALGYPYWVAVTQTDLVAWLTAQQRSSETAALLSQATGMLRSLGAAPALASAQELSRSAPEAIAV